MTLASTPGGISFSNRAGARAETTGVDGTEASVEATSGSGWVWQAETAKSPSAVIMTSPNRGQIRGRMVRLLGDDGSELDEILETRPGARDDADDSNADGKSTW